MKQPTEEIRTLLAKDCELQYLLTRKQVKNINLRIKPDAKIYVSANRRVAASYIDDFVLSKADFIIAAIKKYSEQAQSSPPPCQYTSGEFFHFLGDKLILEVIKSEHETVYADGDYLFLLVKDPQNFKRKESLINSFINSQCKKIFSELSISVYANFTQYNLPFPQIKIRSMKSRWGSCQPKRAIITLNKKLLEVPISCIEYVVLHEFCHFIHPNHSKHFYSFLQSLMPDWKEQKLLLQGKE